MNIVILGAPGSGKGTQAARMAERWNLRHISTGDLLREAVAQKTALGQQVEGIMAKGELVPDEVVLKLTQEAITDPAILTRFDGWILDGFPRTEAQAVGLEDVLSSMRDVVDAVIVLEVDPDVIVDRLSKRRTCVSCKTVYHLDNHPPKEDGKCDADGGELVQREDDKAETIRKRLEVYKRETLPILDLYEQRYDVYNLDGTRPIDEITEEIAGLVNT